MMRTWLATAAFQGRRAVADFLTKFLALATLFTVGAASAFAQSEAGGEASLKLPDLSSVGFPNRSYRRPPPAPDRHSLLYFRTWLPGKGRRHGMVIYMRLKNLPVHRSMREISELIYETCKTCISSTQGKFRRYPPAVGIHRSHHPALLRRASSTWKQRASSSSSPSASSASPAVTASPGSAFASTLSSELAHRLCLAPRQALSRLSDSAGSRHEHRNDADQRRTADHALHPGSSFPATMPDHASSSDSRHR